MPGLQPNQSQHQTLIIEEFEPDVFRQLIEYVHTGCVTLQPRTLLGECLLPPECAGSGPQRTA